jgi:dihydroorotate dehydrogenase subfamily 1
MARTLSVTVNGMTFPNPFVIGSGPPSTNGRMMRKAFADGWGGVVCKTMSLDASKVVNVAPRYGRLRSREKDEVIGFENIELISDMPFEQWLDELAETKQAYPKHMLIASIMEEYNKDAWQEITERCIPTGIDGFELNLSCPHGLPERKMGAAMGQDCHIVEEVTGWVKAVAKNKPVWSKMTPNITHIAEPAAAAKRGGADGVSAINTILSVIGVDLDSLRPQPTVCGHTTPGGYSCQAVRPIALRMVMEIARDVPGLSISGIGGVECATDAIQFMLMGASTVQACTAPMLQGFGMAKELCEGTLAFMEKHGFNSLNDFVGHSVKYFTTHAELVRMQREAKVAKAGTSNRDKEWSGEQIQKQAEELSAL